MGRMSYNKVSTGTSSGKASSSSSSSSSSSRCRGFRLNPRKLYVLRLRKRFNFFHRLFDSWKLSYGEAIQLLKKVVCRKSSGLKRSNSNNSTRSLVRREGKIKGQDGCKMRSCGRSNSFYAEAIADCLEFIKRTSISSMDQSHDPVGHIQDRNS